MRYKVPKVTVDGVLIQENSILLVQRKREPFQGYWALPGGFVEYGEQTENAVVREVLEETGLQTHVQCVVGVYSDPHRDPRGHTITIVYLLHYRQGTPQAGDDAATAKFFKLHQLPPLAFDHEIIIKEIMEKRDHGVLPTM